MLTKRIAFVLFAVTSLVLVGLVTWLTLMLRGELRRVFIEQHGEILHPLAATQLNETREALLLTGDLFDASELLSSVLADVNVESLVDVRLFDTDGFLISEDFGEAISVALHPDDRLRALEGLPSTRYHPDATLQALFPGESSTDQASLGVPLIEVVVPLRDEARGTTMALARYLLKGEETASDLAAVDRQLMTMSGTLLVAALLVLGGLFYWAFRQLQRSHNVIAQSNRRLVELNHQLVFADKSSAIGSLTAHLIHGLKNPLAALRGLFEEAEADPAAAEEHRAYGRERVLEMQGMIEQLVGVMRDEESELAYEYRLEEISELLLEKSQRQASRAGVTMSIDPAPERILTGRQGNVILLILLNLIENALDASKQGDTVHVRFEESSADQGLTIHVRDEGEGIPAELQERLFVPKKSGKDRGTGIGLVISAQLARQLGGELSLVSTGPDGTCFALALRREDR